MTVQEKLLILGEAARYDVSCASSGSKRVKEKGKVGSTANGGICHSWTADGRCVSLLKVLMSNVCIYDCAYCHNRVSNDVPRATFTPEELCELTLGFYRRNYIEGLFLSSGVVKNPDYTMELMERTLTLLREQFAGYIHLKVIPGASALMIHRLGLLADRVSCNIELPSANSLALLAPQKKPQAIIEPMRLIKTANAQALEDGKKFRNAPQFAPAGQSTQMIVGATPDSDLTIMTLARAMYQKMRMRRVYYSAYLPVGNHPILPVSDVPVPLLREHRLYQADFLFRFYGFEPSDLADDRHPNLDMAVDPKAAWALRNIHHFPIEINTADREMLMRIPGLGQISADRIIAARRLAPVQWDHLKKLGVVMKRAQYFLTAAGKFCGKLQPDSPFLRDVLSDLRDPEQTSMFDAPKALPAHEDAPKVIIGRDTRGALLYEQPSLADSLPPSNSIRRIDGNAPYAALPQQAHGFAV
ncbi:MAG: putative DNA modification/repair radical SAM protein [Oscillospiraceae bacterium]|nr:putative DNA modification/repair radical SAM protein [Oscillospiraceae bacterium]